MASLGQSPAPDGSLLVLCATHPELALPLNLVVSVLENKKNIGTLLLTFELKYVMDSMDVHSPKFTGKL